MATLEDTPQTANGTSNTAKEPPRECALALQAILCEIGVTLRNRRWRQDRSIAEVAQALALPPQALVDLEMGRVTPDEFLRVIDTWATILGQESDIFRHQLSGYLSLE
jgi:hypothetical protein